MSEQKKKEAPETTKVESPKIPNVAYPLKPRGNVTNLSQQYFNHLAGDESARFLFNNSGLWHQGIHLRASKFPSSEFENDKICAIADGKLIAYKVDSEYKKDSEVEVPMKSAVYSTGYFLLKHKMAYPKDNVLTFYSLYRHTAKLSDYPPKKRYVTKSADANPVAIKDRRGVVIAQLADGLIISIKSPNSKASRHEIESYQDEQGQIHRPSNGDIWTIYKGSYHQEEDSTQHAIPFLSQNNIETEADKEVLLSGNRQIEVKAGEVLGLMGEYNQTGKSGEKLLHLEVFTYDDIEQFRAKAEAAYKQDKEKKGIKDNFLYVARGSQLYTVLKDEVVELEKTQVEIMVPLADVAKQTVKKKTDKTGKDYYNVQPYLYSLLENNNDGGIYVDDSHLTHGLLFPGVNVFNQTENGLCIFKHGLHQHIDPKSDLTIEQKNELDPMFKSIMDELDLDKDKNAAVSFEAGKLKDLLLSSVQQRRLTGIVAKHDSEWKKTRAADFIRTCGTYRDNNKEDSATRIEKRVEDLSIKLEVDGFNTDKQAYYLHPLGMIGWLMPYSTCFCHRDFTVDEVKNIIQQLRDSEPSVKKMLGYSLFSASNCNIPASEATYENFTKELNIAMKKYDINTCLRKIHFLAQCYHESAHFSTSQELGSEKYLKGKPYYPYIGRGIIQLTHSGETADAIGYKQYFEYIGRNDYKKNYALLNQDLHLAVDASGYFWKRGKLLNAGDLLNARYPNPSGVKVKYQKTKLSTHTTIDINLVADDDNTRQVTFLVNGGQYAIEERISYVNELKRIFNYESNHLKK
jgi:glycoside hydrolase, family 19, putative